MVAGCRSTGSLTSRLKVGEGEMRAIEPKFGGADGGPGCGAEERKNARSNPIGGAGKVGPGIASGWGSWGSGCGIERKRSQNRGSVFGTQYVVQQGLVSLGGCRWFKNKGANEANPQVAFRGRSVGWLGSAGGGKGRDGWGWFRRERSQFRRRRKFPVAVLEGAKESLRICNAIRLFRRIDGGHGQDAGRDLALYWTLPCPSPNEGHRARPTSLAARFNGNPDR